MVSFNEHRSTFFILVQFQRFHSLSFQNMLLYNSNYKTMINHFKRKPLYIENIHEFIDLNLYK